MKQFQLPDVMVFISNVLTPAIHFSPFLSLFKTVFQEHTEIKSLAPQAPATSSCLHEPYPETIASMQESSPASIIKQVSGRLGICQLSSGGDPAIWVPTAVAAAKGQNTHLSGTHHQPLPNSPGFQPPSSSTCVCIPLLTQLLYEQGRELTHHPRGAGCSGHWRSVGLLCSRCTSTSSTSLTPRGQQSSLAGARMHHTMLYLSLVYVAFVISIVNSLCPTKNTRAAKHRAAPGDASTGTLW